MLETIPYNVVANVIECDIVENESELQLRYFVHFRASSP